MLRTSFYNFSHSKQAIFQQAFGFNLLNLSQILIILYMTSQSLAVADPGGVREGVCSPFSCSLDPKLPYKLALSVVPCASRTQAQTPSQKNPKWIHSSLAVVSHDTILYTGYLTVGNFGDNLISQFLKDDILWHFIFMILENLFRKPSHLIFAISWKLFSKDSITGQRTE